MRPTRAQGLEDGSLMDVTDVAAEVGYPYPVALSRRIVAINERIDLSATEIVKRLQEREKAGVASTEIHFDLYGFRVHAIYGSECGQTVVTLMLQEEVGVWI